VTTPLDLTAHEERAHQVWTLVLVSLGLFMTALDTLVVTTALPALRTSLHTDLSSLEWTVNAYNLAFACSLMTGAALGDRFGRRRIFCVGLSIFTAASVGSALAPSVGVLIATRAMQGAGAALVFPLTLTLISEAFPPEKRGAAVGIWGGIAGLAVAIGPIVGGAIVEGLNWHWIFWLNVPIGAVLIPLAASRLRESHGPRPRLDLVGLALASAGFFGITWGLIRANTVGWRSSEVVIGLVAGVLLVGLFLWWEQHTRTPMLTLALFRRASFNGSNGTSFFMYASLFGVVFLMSQFFQTAQHLSPLQTGVRLLPWTGAPMIVSPIAGKLAERFGNRPFMIVGMLLQGIGFAWIAVAASGQVSYADLVVPLGLAGVGISMVFPTVSTEAISSVPPDEVGIASGTNSSLRELGGVFGVAVLASVFSRPGIYGSSEIFVQGFRAALWVGAAFAMAGVFAAMFASRQSSKDDQTAYEGQNVSVFELTTVGQQL
jgi:EmrB/QacA subfamily drug resistance transporter